MVFRLIGILKAECAVRPLGSSSAAIPLLATAIAIFPSDLIRVSANFAKYVLPVPPGASRSLLGFH